MNKNILITLFFLSMLVVIPILSVVISGASGDIRSRARTEVVLPVLPPASPFIRLGKSVDSVSTGSMLPIFVTSKTLNQSVVEVQIVVTYDPEIVRIEEKNIRNDNVFSTLNVVSNEPGKLVFSVFSSTESGYDPVTLNEEQRIATMFFRVVGSSTDTLIRLENAAEEKTALYTARDENTGIAPDILASTQDVLVQVR